MALVSIWTASAARLKFQTLAAHGQVEPQRDAGVGRQERATMTRVSYRPFLCQHVCYTTGRGKLCR